VYAPYSRIDNQSALNKGGNLAGLAYAYELFLNTKLYASWGRMANKGTSTYGLADGGDIFGNVTTTGVNPSGLMFGLNVNF
jgi:hypothetical protein